MSLSEIMAGLEEIKKADEASWESDLLKRTVVKLLAVEKKATYGVLRGKGRQISEIIDSEFKNYKDELDEN
jgi:hypothetical protein